ncbi:MAG: NADP oxidoreductase [Bdellovibrionaceae bacterium]|jgi:coenzyme F420-reducing hydrogenase gamma subunit|nr:NADP oxidoreductase [Pseudobdellovibrionaceae bacterium]
MTKNKKVSLATISLAGCFGCHMSFLDMDMKVVDLVDLVDLHTSPFNDLKDFTQKVDVGLIEGGVCNDENVERLRSFRKNCKILISLGECAIMGGLPALRNNIPLKDCLEEAYVNTPTTDTQKGIIPHHEDIPKILDKVYPCHEVVKIDYFLPGCPPSADAIWQILTDLIHGKEPQLNYGQIKYD